MVKNSQGQLITKKTYKKYEGFLDIGRTYKKEFTEGWKIIGKETGSKIRLTGKDLYLNSIGKAYDFKSFISEQEKDNPFFKKM